MRQLFLNTVFVPFLKFSKGNAGCRCNDLIGKLQFFFSLRYFYENQRIFNQNKNTEQERNTGK